MENSSSLLTWLFFPFWEELWRVLLEELKRSPTCKKTSFFLANIIRSQENKYTVEYILKLLNKKQMQEEKEAANDAIETEEPQGTAEAF